MATDHGNAKGTTAHTEVDGHAKASFPPFEKDTFPSQLVSFAIAFALLYVIVSKFALPRVGSVIAAREGTIENDLAEAQKLKDESDAAIKAYETDLAQARARAQAIGSETRERLNAQSEAERKTLEANLPGLVALHDRVAEIPGIRAYLDSDRRLAFNEDGIFRHYPELDAA